ncbi:Ca(2+)-dependent cysteine protease [Taxawa tesnikishii (nom. ined.)]|nr:Ca(2+)-dependent cysteine protease [Dothideales sp. JES 119]
MAAVGMVHLPSSNILLRDMAPRLRSIRPSKATAILLPLHNLRITTTAHPSAATVRRLPANATSAEPERIWLRSSKWTSSAPGLSSKTGVPHDEPKLLRQRQLRRSPPPPTQAQAFGHGAPGNYTFQYSNCTGRRKALLIGINYFGQRGQLRGCINDVKNMSTYLNEHFGYKREDMVILTDDQQNPMSQPTKANIFRAMHWLVKDARPNDSLFFHYSGHGGQTKDLDGDEEDGYDEVIYPVDFRQAGHIVDDEMHRIMVRPLRPGVRLTAIFDSCHSGSALDLPYIYSTQGILKEPNLAKEAGQGLLGIVSSYARGDLGGMASTALGLFKKATSGDAVYERNKQTKTSPADVIMWSGSKDSQTSADAAIAGQATGAMSWAFVTALKKNPQQSYVQLLNSIRDELEGRYSQKPQLSCSHPLNTNLLYVM